MPVCPECGGSVPLSRLMAVTPGPARCRWCNSRVRLPRWGRVLRDAVVVIAGAVSVVYCVVHYRLSLDAQWLMVALVACAGALSLGFIVEAFLPLVTLSGRAVSPISPPRAAHEDEEPQPDTAARRASEESA